MKQIINKSIQFIFLSLVVMAFTGCLKDEDLLTDGVRTGGLVNVPGNIPYKLGFTPTLDIDINAGQGAPIKSILVYKQYFHNADTTESNKVLYATIDVNSANASKAFNETLSLTWNDLIAGLTLPDYTLPANEATADIGDYFVFSYVSVMASDNKEIINLSTTTVAIANLFAGTYTSYRTYFHPSVVAYPDSTKAYGFTVSKMDLVAVDPNTCKVYFGSWKDNYVFIHIDITNHVSLTFDRTAFEGDPWDSSKKCSYNPTSGIIQIYYYYHGAAGADPANPTGRIFWQKFVPL